MSLPRPLRLSFLGALILSGCHTAPERAGTPAANQLPDPEGRVYNPESRNFEWSTPGRPPVSPGAESTSRQPFR